MKDYVTVISICVFAITVIELSFPFVYSNSSRVNFEEVNSRSKKECDKFCKIDYYAAHSAI